VWDEVGDDALIDAGGGEWGVLRVSAHYQHGVAAPPLVLVVDDNLDLREGIAEVLEGEGFAVATAPSADAAVRLVERGPAPDAILLDLVMPGMSALRFVSLLRDLAGGGRARVILCSAAIDYDTCDFPADAFLPKPFRIEQLLGTLRGVGVEPPQLPGGPR
jgi:CheY-like chemotaxis protein